MSWRRPRACATLACVRRPATGRLNSGVRRQKSVWWLCFSTRLLYRLRLVLLSGRFFSALLLRSSLSGALIHHMCCVGRLRKRCLVSVSVPLLMLSFLTGPAESLRVRVRVFPLRFSASAPRLRFYRHPKPPNNSFKPTPHRGVNSVLCATLARCRRPAVGRLNSSVRRLSNIITN